MNDGLGTDTLLWLSCQEIIRTARILGAALIDDGRWAGGIEAIWPPVFDEHNGWVRCGRFRGWIACIAPMLVNNRLVLAPERNPDRGYDHGWCYPRGGKAILALGAWRVDRDDEPPGAFKRATAAPFTTATCAGQGAGRWR